MAKKHRLNTSVVMAAVHGLLGLLGRTSTLSPSSLPSMSPSLISILTSVDVKQNIYCEIRHTSIRNTPSVPETRVGWGGGLYMPLGGTIFEDVALEEFMCLVFTRMPGESYRRRLRSSLLCACDGFRVLINSLVCY